MTVHSFHIFDRRGKTLYTKCYVKKPIALQKKEKSQEEELEALSEQRKLVFGMLFSLRELSSSLSPSDGPGDLQMVKTGASTLYNYETVSGLRFVLYTTADTSNKRGNASNSSNTSSAATTPQSSVHGSAGMSGSAPILTAPTTTGLINSATALTIDPNNNSFHNSNSTSLHGTNSAITTDIRSSLKHIYETIWVNSVIRSPMYRPSSKDNSESIKNTNFESELDTYFKRKSWFR